MSPAVKLEVVPETAQRDGGHAIIRLLGVQDLAPTTTFRIEPVDDEAGTSAFDGWPSGAQAPLEIRPTDGGFDLLVGPDVVDNVNLRAGTPVAIVIDALKFRQELLWPSLTPTISPRRPARVLTMTQSAAMTQALRDAERRQAVVAQLSKSTAAAEPAPEQLRASLGQQAASAASIEAAAQARPAASAAAGLSALSTGRDRPPPPVDPLPVTPVRLQKVETPTTDRPPAVVTDTTATPVYTGEGEQGSRSYSVAVRGDQGGYVADIVARRRSNVSLVFGTLALMVASAAAGFAYKSSQVGPGTVPLTTASVGIGDASRVPVAPSTVYDMFKTPDAADVKAKLKSIDRDASLSIADTLIHSAGSERDLREAEALLKHGLALSLGDKSTLWALTQLGSLSAQPSTGEPDYQRARLLWEIAGALGDPVAMCFLGELHEFGLGVPTNKPAARKWYLQAKQAGGCSTVDAALARIK